jgi:hypothetical protein
MIHTSDVEYILKYNNRNINRHERQAKYNICIVLGNSVDNSRRMRDWTLSHIALNSHRFIIRNSEVSN